MVTVRVSIQQGTNDIIMQLYCKNTTDNVITGAMLDPTARGESNPPDNTANALTLYTSSQTILSSRHDATNLQIKQHLLNNFKNFTLNYIASFLEHGNTETFDLNVANFSTKVQDLYSTQNGLRLLLNVNQSEYCGVARKWYGAGFRTYIHDTQVMSEYHVNPPLQLYPGSDVVVSIKPTQFIRNTEHLGKCAQFENLLLFPFVSKYNQEICYIQCLTEIIWHQCHCLLSWHTLLLEFMIKYFNISKNNIKLCSIANQKCLKELESRIYNLPVQSECRYCKRPCYETKYDYSVTTLKFPQNRLRSMYADQLHVPEKEIEKHFLHVSYNFENMNVMVVEENQAVTIKDVFIYFGGLIGLFLGMSFVSLAEPFHYAVFWIHGKSSKKKNQVHRLKDERNICIFKKILSYLKKRQEKIEPGKLQKFTEPIKLKGGGRNEN